MEVRLDETERDPVAVAELVRERRVVAETELVPFTLTLAVVVDDVERDP